MSTSATTTETTAVTAPGQRTESAAPTGGLTKAGRPSTPATGLTAGPGRTSIASVVVRKIAGVATREVPGVHELGTGGKRAVGAVRQRVPGSGGPSVSQGVSVEVGEREAAVDLDVVVEFGASMVRVAEAIRTNVIRSVERLTGLTVVEVNVSFDDVYVPQEDNADPGRVQ